MFSQNFSAVSRTPANSLAGSHIRIDGLSKAYPDRRVLTNVSFAVASGERACLVGENGSGKTTLLRIVAGIDDDFDGAVSVPGIVGLYHQELPFPLTWSLAEVIADATSEHRVVLQAIEETGNAIAAGEDGASSRFEEALATAERIGAWDIDSVADRLLHGFGLNAVEQKRRVSAMSGGQQARLSLAWLLLSSPDTLLLDEPTNHLDDGAADLLASLLASWNGPVLIASHDRAFIDAVATTIMDLDPAPSRHADTVLDDSPGSGFGITKFSGTYTDFVASRSRERELWEKQYRDEQEELKELRARVGRGHATDNPSRPIKTEQRAAVKFYSDRNAKAVSRRVRDAERALEQLNQDQVRKPPAELSFAGLSVAGGQSYQEGFGDQTVLVGSGLGVEGRLAPIDISIRQTDRLLMTGENGSGKSTLLKILCGEIETFDGSLNYPARTTIAALAQDVGRILARRIPDRDWRKLSVVDVYGHALSEELVEQVPLRTFGLIAGRDHNRIAGSLSTGQQRRLELAVLLADPPDILLLDEPTNHFSLKLTTELENSIADYPGAVVVASHDRWLRKRWAGRTMHLEPSD
ncbi:MAG: ABC-F family ATP-binding cassette domain-containing protein [Flaviflexus sp.]|uniref:ABC-F family ATP-binding cassette domain-containing protein n=1 Tax=Flaviflexus sp. TaxID=1969482 RepID=UPI00352C4368